MKNIVIFGSGGHSKVIIDIIEKQNKYNIVGLIDKFRNKGEETLGYKVLGREEDLPKLIKEYIIKGGIIAIGDNWVRNKVYSKIKKLKPDFKFIKAIHPNAVIGKSVEVGEGTAIMAGTIINSNTKIGKQCIVNTKSSLDHDCYLGNFSSLAPNVTAGGNVSIKKFSAISLSANIIHNKKIGEHTVIGAGSLILKDQPSFSVIYGIPGKIIRKRNKGDKYL